MRIEFSIRPPVARFALALAALLTGALLFALTAIHFVVSVYAFPRTTLTRDEVTAAARYLPNAPELQALLAEVEMAEARDHKASADRAVYAATRAVNLSPKRYEFHLLQSVARELSGDRAGAEASMREALTRAPNRAELQWRLANLLVRNGKLEESLDLYAQTVSTRPSLLPQTLNLLWNVTGEKVELVERGVGETPKARIDLAFFLFRKGKIDEAVAMFRKIDGADRRNHDESEPFITAVIMSGQMKLARELWGELIIDSNNPGEREALKPLVFNGSFERDPVPRLGHFDWTLGSNKWMRAVLDPGTAHSGRRSLRIDFLGVDTTRIDKEIRQQVVVRPGARYRLECFVKTESFAAPEGPRLSITSIDGGTVYATSQPLGTGSSDWQRLSVDFVAPAIPTLLLSVRRIPQFAYDDPARGRIWFDDFELTELGAGH
jgi:tetratricopeptide (TPR) repeat protein